MYSIFSDVYANVLKVADSHYLRAQFTPIKHWQSLNYLGADSSCLGVNCTNTDLINWFRILSVEGSFVGSVPWVIATTG